MDIVEILKVGLPGLVFLLSMLAYRLLSQEQNKEKPSPTILKSIKQFMYVNIFLAILTVTASVIERPPTVSQKEFNVTAKLSGTPLNPIDYGQAAVCTTAKYKNRFILVNNAEKGKMVQVYANGMLPCNSKEYLLLNKKDATQLGLSDKQESRLVDISIALPAQTFSVVVPQQTTNLVRG